MGQPTPPTPGAPADAPTPPTPPTPALPPTPGPDPTEPVDVAALPANVQNLIKSLRREAGDHRTGKTAAEQQAQQAQERLNAMLKAAGFNPDGTEDIDPEKATAQLAERLEMAQNALWTYGVKSAMEGLGPATGANVPLVYDSQSFRDTLDDLLDGDPSTPEFRTVLEAKMREFVAANPAYAAQSGGTPTGTAPRPDPSQGTRGGAAPYDGNLTKAIAQHYAGLRTK